MEVRNFVTGKVIGSIDPDRYDELSNSFRLAIRLGVDREHLKSQLDKYPSGSVERQVLWNHLAETSKHWGIYT